MDLPKKNKCGTEHFVASVVVEELQWVEFSCSVGIPEYGILPENRIRRSAVQDGFGIWSWIAGLEEDTLNNDVTDEGVIVRHAFIVETEMLPMA